MKKAILILLFILITAYPCSAKENARREVKRGNTLYNEGKFNESLEHYEKASSAKPNSGIVNYNIGAASYKLNDYEKAAISFNRALTEEEDKLIQQTSYNLANSEYMLGISKENSNLQEAIGLLTESLRHYEKALELDKEDKDAIFNYEYVKKELKRLQEKKQQQKQQQQQQQQKQEAQGTRDKEQKERPQDKKEEQKEQPQDKKEEQKEQQDKQEEQKEQQKEQSQDKKEEQPKQEEQKQKESSRGQNARESAESSASSEEMSDKQASMLLDNYRHDEEPKGLYRQRVKLSSMPDVNKDW